MFLEENLYSFNSTNRLPHENIFNESGVRPTSDPCGRYGTVGFTKACITNVSLFLSWYFFSEEEQPYGHASHVIDATEEPGRLTVVFKTAGPYEENIIATFESISEAVLSVNYKLESGASGTCRPPGPSPPGTTPSWGKKR